MVLGKGRVVMSICYAVVFVDMEGDTPRMRGCMGEEEKESRCEQGGLVVFNAYLRCHK